MLNNHKKITKYVDLFQYLNELENVSRYDDEEQGNLRVDWAFVTDNEDCNVVWVNKMDNSKSFGYNNGIYNLLGVGLNFPNTNCMTIKDLSQKLSDYINMLIR